MIKLYIFQVLPNPRTLCLLLSGCEKVFQYFSSLINRCIPMSQLYILEEKHFTKQLKQGFQDR